MNDTLLRQWHLLRALPRYPQKITAGELRDRVLASDFQATKRTIERDLDQLSKVFPITVDDRSKPYGWSWMKDAPSLSVPGLTTTQALAFAMIRQFLPSMLPGSLLEELKPYFRDAEACLATLPKGRGRRSWTEKVRIVPPTQPLLAPKPNAAIPHTLYEALLQGRQANVVYQKRGARGPVEYTIHPLGLIQRGAITYLACTLFHYTDVLLLAVHRVRSAALLDDPAACPDGFTLDTYIGGGAAHFGEGKKVRLRARFRRETADHLAETPLAPDQTMSVARNGWVAVSATVLDTPQLLWWLQGFGAQVQVLAPARLRKTIAEDVRALYRHYGPSPGKRGASGEPS